MKRLVVSTLCTLTLVGLFWAGYTLSFEGEVNASVEEEKVVWKAGEKIPFANSKVTIEEVNHEDGTKVVTEYTMGPNGEWRSEILEHPSDFGEGVVMIWDTEKFYTYYPKVDSVTVREDYTKNQKVVAHPLLGSVFHSNVLGQGKAIEKRPDFDVYSKKSTVVKAKDNQRPETIPAEERHYVNKETKKVAKIEKVIKGEIVRSIAVKNIKRDFNPPASLFKIDLSQVKQVIK